MSIIKAREIEQVKRAGEVSFDACHKINPKNILAAAEAIEDLFTACKRAVAAAENPDDFIEGAAAYEALKAAIKKATAE